MKFNAFADIYNKHNELPPTLIEKIMGAFWVFWGEILDAYTHNEYKEDSRRLGLFDYFTFGIFFLNHIVFSTILKGNVTIYLLLAPIIILNCIVLAVDFTFRFLTAIILTILTMPIIILVHIVSTELERRNVKKVIDNNIKDGLDLERNSVTIKIPTHFKGTVLEVTANHLTDILNQNPKVTELAIDYSTRKTALLNDLISKLKYVTKLSVRNGDGAYTFDPIRGSCPTPNIDQTLKMLQQSHLKELHTSGQIKVKNLLNFFTNNTQLNVLDIRRINYGNSTLGGSLEEFNNMVGEIGIQHPCKLLVQNDVKFSGQINSTMDQIRESYLSLGPCFEFCKIWCTGDNKNSLDGNRDILQYILMMFIKMCPNDIVEKNKNGFIKTMKSNGFFYQPPPSPTLIGSDAQNQSNDTVIDITNLT